MRITGLHTMYRGTRYISEEISEHPLTGPQEAVAILKEKGVLLHTPPLTYHASEPAEGGASLWSVYTLHGFDRDELHQIAAALGFPARHKERSTRTYWVTAHPQEGHAPVVRNHAPAAGDPRAWVVVKATTREGAREIYRGQTDA